MSRASAQRAASAVATAFESDGFTLADETVLGLSGTLAYKRVFRWRWYATRLHIFSFVVGLERADIETVQQQTEALIELALLRKPPCRVGWSGYRPGSRLFRSSSGSASTTRPPNGHAVRRRGNSRRSGFLLSRVSQAPWPICL
jgi:hypothetical protein